MPSDIARFRRRHRELRHLLRTALRMQVTVPASGTGTVIEEDYQELLQTRVRHRRPAGERKTGTSCEDLMDYFTLWAHQIKTPIAAMACCCRQEGRCIPSGELEAELFKIEQYVNMVHRPICACRQRLPPDYVLRTAIWMAWCARPYERSARLFILQENHAWTFTETGHTVVTDEKWLSFVVGQMLSQRAEIYPGEGRSSDLWRWRRLLVIADTGIGHPGRGSAPGV